jgi:hypothetical protein
MAVIQADGVEQKRLLCKQTAADGSDEDKHSSMRSEGHAHRFG